MRLTIRLALLIITMVSFGGCAPQEASLQAWVEAQATKIAQLEAMIPPTPAPPVPTMTPITNTESRGVVTAQWVNAPIIDGQVMTADVIQAKRLVLVDQDAKERVSIQLAEGEPIIGFVDGQGKVRALLSLGQNGDPMLTFNGPDEKTQIQLAASSDGTATLMFPTGGGSPPISLTLVNGDKPFLSLTAPGSKNSVSIMPATGGQMSVVVIDGSGKTKWWAP